LYPLTFSRRQRVNRIYVLEGQVKKAKVTNNSWVLPIFRAEKYSSAEFRVGITVNLLPELLICVTGMAKLSSPPSASAERHGMPHLEESKRMAG